MTESAKLPRIGGDHHLHGLRMIRAGGRRPEHVANFAPTTGTVADLALDDLADVGAVVDPAGPRRELLHMAWRAVRRAFVLRFVGSYLRDRVTAIVPVLVKRIDREEFLRAIREYSETDQYEDESNDMSRHGAHNAWPYPTDFSFLLARLSECCCREALTERNFWHLHPARSSGSCR